MYFTYWVPTSQKMALEYEINEGLKSMTTRWSTEGPILKGGTPPLQGQVSKLGLGWTLNRLSFYQIPQLISFFP